MKTGLVLCIGVYAGFLATLPRTPVQQSRTPSIHLVDSSLVAGHWHPLGVADVKREGTDVTIVARSLMVPVALKAAETLEQQGVSCEVIDPRTIRPLDIDTIIVSVKKTNRVVVAEESHPICGVGAEISAEIMERAFDYLDAPVKRVSGADVPMPYAKNLENLAIPDVDRVVAAVREVAYLD